MLGALNSPRRSSSEFYTPYTDQELTFGAAASSQLDPVKLASCKMIVLRVISGDARFRVIGVDASASEGATMFAGDIVILNRFEADRLSGIRGGSTDCVVWATYYR